MMKEKGTLSYAVVYILVFIITIFIFVVGIPFMLAANHAFFGMGTTILDQGQGFANKITNQSVKVAMTNIFTTDKAAFITGEPVLVKFAQYGWIFVIIVITFVVILLARRAEQLGQGLI
ncbi:MAG: hypothetical protein MUP17_04975 [candidate division Zixibacteria bacterium]|nr:hypothetical protein [candidate division Zixibacteria bacterium]